MNSMTLLPFLRRAVATGVLAAISTSPSTVRAADHRDAPNTAHDAATDLADTYFFLDPNNNGTDDRIILIATFHGFIVPGEAANEAIFDPTARYHFELYNEHVNDPVPVPPDPATATAADKAAYKRDNARYLASIKPSQTIDVTFSPRVGGSDPNALAGKQALEIPTKQTARVQFTGFTGIKKTDQFHAFCLNPNLSSSPQTPTASDLLDKSEAPMSPNIKIFAGECDDPFFFDIPGFAGVIQNIRTGATPSFDLSRGRDTFAGYNTLAIALSVPVALVKNADGTKTKIGLNVVTQRHTVQMPPNAKTGEVKAVGSFKAVDREGNPAVNVVLVPFSSKNRYNVATPKDDAALKFVGGTGTAPFGILDTLAALGTTGTPFDPNTNVGLLASIAVLHGDLLTLDTSVANTGTGGGTNTQTGFGTAGGGRRLQDDVVDTLLYVVTNHAVTPQVGATPGGDNVGANDETFQDAFPFLAPTHQPLASGVIDDGTRN